VVYSRKVNDQLLTFGISGRLYKSNVLLYDHQSESLWSQLKAQAISGDLAGRQLQPIASVRMGWKQWRRQYPRTTVLSPDTGYHRDYSIDPYAGYYQIGSLMFPVGKVRLDLSAKARVLGIAIDGAAKAYPLEYLKKKIGTVAGRIGQTQVFIEVSPEGEVVAVRNKSGKMIPHTFVYWFAWQAFYPQTTIAK
jgi:uncharacterized protein YuzE